MPDTSYDRPTVEDAAQRIGSIMNDMSPFTELAAGRTDFGSFQNAQWLEQVVDERAVAVAAHAELLRTALGEFGASLTAIVGDLDATDGDNAAALQAQAARWGAVVDGNPPQRTA